MATSSRHRGERENLMDLGIKDPRRVQAGKKAVETRKYYEGENVMREQGRKGGEARRGSTGSDDLSSMASYFRTTLDTKDPRRVQAGKQAAETRKMREGEDVFREMGKKGGQVRAGRDDDSHQRGEGSSGKRYQRDGDNDDLEEDEPSHQRRRRSLDQHKDPRRVRSGRKAAETRKAHEDEEREDEGSSHQQQETQHEARVRAGKKGAAARWGKSQDDADQDRDEDMRPARRQQQTRSPQRDEEYEYPDELSSEEFEDAIAQQKDPSRVLAGKQSAVTRRAREGPDVFSRMGKAGAEARNQSRDQEDGQGDDDQSESEHEEEVHLHRVIGGIKGARTRKQREGSDVFSRMGKAGAEARWGRDQDRADGEQRGQAGDEDDEDEDAQSEHEQEVHLHRIIGGIRAARTRKIREGPEVFHEMGRMGAAARWGADGQTRGKTRGGARDDDEEDQERDEHEEEVHRHRVQGGKKGAQTLKREYGHDYYHQLGEMGARARWGR